MAKKLFHISYHNQNTANGRGVSFVPRANVGFSTEPDSTPIWSIGQAETYIRAIASDMSLLVRHPAIARERLEIRPPVRVYRSGSHLIIYRIEASWLDVLHIVHARQNWTAYLNE